MICKTHPCLKLTCMIGADLVPISHVSSSHQLDCSLHVGVIVGMLRHNGGAAMQRALLDRSQFRCDGCHYTRWTCYASTITDA